MKQINTFIKDVRRKKTFGGCGSIYNVAAAQENVLPDK